MSTIILADGDFPSSEKVLGILRDADRVVCCDRAAEAYLHHGFGLPTLVVGDLDSLSPAVRLRLGGRIVHDPNQENNDLAKAFTVCLERGWHDIIILGATGRREDHTLGNIGWLADFAREVPAISMVTDYGIFSIVQAPGGEVATHPGLQISFFSFDLTQEITAEGVVYPVERLRLPRWHRATLNEANGSCVRLRFEGEPIVVYRADFF